MVQIEQELLKYLNQLEEEFCKHYTHAHVMMGIMTIQQLAVKHAIVHAKLVTIVDQLTATHVILNKIDLLMEVHVHVLLDIMMRSMILQIIAWVTLS